MGKGKKRNQPCWCGSRKKYKNCHEKREYEEKVEIYEIDKDLRNSYSKKRCLAPKELMHECSKKVIKAHTVSKSSNLKQIAKDGHVLSFKKSIQDLVKHNGKFLVEKVGINSASIINGFCSKHDKELFAIIEDVKFTFTNEQIFMLAYRGISRELYLKFSSIQVQENEMSTLNRTNF